MEGARADDMIFTELRALVFLRRIARAQERIADATDELCQIERDRWQRECKLRTGTVRPTEFASFDVDAANERYRAELEAAEVGATLEDRSQ